MIDMTQNKIETKLIQTGLYCGLVASILFPIWSVVKFPMQINLLLHFVFGPLIVIAFMAIQTLLKQQYDSVSS